MKTSDRLMKLADDNAKVTGTYFGKEFSGIAVSSRWMAWPGSPEQLTIELDEELDIFGLKRKGILVNSQDIDNGTHTVN